MLNEESLIEVFKNYEDPELHIDVWTLGLIYEHKVEGENVFVKLTFTSPFCPFGPQMVEELKARIRNIGAKEVTIEVTFEPAWQPSEEVKEVLGLS